MAWTSLTFAYGSVLTSAKMTQLYDDLTAIASGLPDAPFPRRSALLVPGSYYVNSMQLAATNEDVTSQGYTEVVNSLVTQAGTIRARFYIAAHFSNPTIYGRLYKNGVAVGSEHTTTTSASLECFDDITSCMVGDTLQLFVKTSNATFIGARSNLQFGMPNSLFLSEPRLIALGVR